MAKIQVQGIGVYDDKTLKKKIIQLASDLQKNAKKGDWNKASENGIRALGRMWQAYQDWSRQNESINEAGMELNKLKDAIKMFQKKIEKQGRVTNARDEEHLSKLIKLYNQMGGKGIKESITEGPDADLGKKLKQIQNQIYKLGHQYKSKANVPAMMRSFMLGVQNQLKKDKLTEKIKNTETGFKWKQIPKSGTINFGKYGKYVILSKNNHRVSGKFVSGPQKGKKVTWYSREGQKDARKRKGMSISDTPAFPKTMVKEAMLNERITKAFMVHPTDPSQTERHWVDRFEELADGHGPIIDYGPRESDIYDWNDRRNYKKAIEEYNKYMGKIADGLNKQVNLMNNIWRVWSKISEKYRKIDKS